MTSEELRALDAEVHREVMGLEPCQCWFSINTGPNGECENCGKSCPFYSQSIAAAWQVVEKMEPYGVIRVSNGDGDSRDCDFIARTPFEPYNFGTASEETWPLAICRAALQAVRGKKPAPAAPL